MFNRLITPLMMVLAISLSTGFVSAQEASTTKPAEGDNPQYLAWKDFAIGSSVTLNFEATGKNALKMVVTMTLSEKSAQSVAVSIATEIEINGQKTTNPVQKHEIPAKDNDQGMTLVGTEDVTVPAGTFQTNLYNLSTPTGSGGKVWLSSKVPGGVVRMELKNEQGELKGALASYEVK